jgi:hypothetical protein
MTHQLIHPDRGKSLRRHAHRHAAAILRNALAAGWDPDYYFPDQTERDLVLDEVEAIAGRLLLAAIAGTRQRCSACNLSYLVKKDGTMHPHNGVDQAGFSTGEPCPGVNHPPSLD